MRVRPRGGKSKSGPAEIEGVACVAEAEELLFLGACPFDAVGVGAVDTDEEIYAGEGVRLCDLDFDLDCRSSPPCTTVRRSLSLSRCLSFPLAESPPPPPSAVADDDGKGKTPS